MRCNPCPVACDRPCLGETPRFAIFCAWAAGGDPAKLRHVVGRSAFGEAPPAPVDTTDRAAIERRRAGKPRIPLGVRPTGRDPGRR